MKAIILSDSHRMFTGVVRAMERETPVDLMIHAGDVQQDVDDMMVMWPNIPCEYVLGNNDFMVQDVPYERFFTFGGKKIFLCHGHLFHVKRTLLLLEEKARSLGADVCIFGHTHTPYLEEKDGLWILNPGSSRMHYAILQVENGEIKIELKEN